MSVDHSATANYQPNDMLSFGTSVGAQYNSRQSTRFEADGDEFASPIFTSLTNILDYDDPFHRVTENNSLGIFIQEVVGFNDRLFVTAAVRADDHSAFGGDFDFIYYPKASATWVLSEENFWNVDLVNSFRVRGAWGESGRQPDAFARVAQYQSVPGPDGSPAIRVADPGNENVGPETSSEIEAGFDIALMDDRISGEFTYFKQWVRDAILNLSLAPSDPYIGNVQANLGELQNWGWEAGFDFQVLDNDWVNFDLRLSGDHTMNRITRLSEEQSRANFQEGWFYPNITFVRVNTATLVDPTDLTAGVVAMCDSGDPNSPQGLAPGGPSRPCADVIAQDNEGKLMAGPAFPTYTWSVAPTLRFLDNSLELFALAEGQYGRWLANRDLDLRSSGFSFVPAHNSRQSMLRDDTMWEAARQFDDERYHGKFDASFWRLREVGLRYQLPRSLVERTGGDRASISISGRNLWTIWRRTGKDLSGVRIPDPESVLGLSGKPTLSFQNLPSLSSFSVVLRVSF